MNEQAQKAFEERTRTMFEGSVEDLDMRIRSRLTQARHAALETAAPRPRFARRAWWMRAAGVTAATVLGVALWSGTPSTRHGVSLADAQTSFEDLDIVASADDSSGDAMDML